MLWSCLPFDQQDERYQHLSAEEMGVVEKSVSEALGWMNAKMNAQSKLTVAQDPAVRVAEIIQKIQVCALLQDKYSHITFRPVISMITPVSLINNEETGIMSNWHLKKNIILYTVKKAKNVLLHDR